MRKVVILLFLILILVEPIHAFELTAPEAPESADIYLPEQSTTFLQDLLYIVKQAIAKLYPSFTHAASLCFSVLAVVMLVSILRNVSGKSAKVVDLVGIVAVTATLLAPSNALIAVGVKTVTTISEYGKLLLPVLTTALAAEGGTTTSTTLYIGTMLFNTILTVVITKLLIPLLYIYIALGIAKEVIQEPIIGKLHGFLKWLITWTLKISIYLFTGYLGITGVVGGTVDAAAIKATKLAISGSVPVVGNIISDASETILVGAGVLKNSIGIYGMLTVVAVWIGPFLQIGAQYLVLKITTALSEMFGCKQAVSVIENFSSTMGFIVAITGTVSVLMMISIVCFIKGVA